MNRLADSGSPYLLQHAHNPVDWYPWSDEAFEKAAKENKPVLLSIGYSACHWCHVMERESFENPDIANVMNEFFVNIKLDREEHPEIDQIYMEAAQYLNGNAGWPLNCFLLPDRRPFYSGTYFPPAPVHGRPSWLQVLTNIAKVWEQKRPLAVDQAERLTKLIQEEGKNEFHDSLSKDTGNISIGLSDLELAYNNIVKQFDWKHGGFGNAPKFPMFNSIRFLLHYYYLTGQEEALNYAEHSMVQMCRGGIFDQLAGGMARYSTDDYWLAPHFEKMLYDNAQFILTACQLNSIKSNSELMEAVAATWSFLDNEMKAPNGLYYAALDADSEGVEGKYYVWEKDEFDRICGNDSGLMSRFLDVSQEGNWEGKNILNRKWSHTEFLKEFDLEIDTWRKIWDTCRLGLLNERRKRIRPGLDDKIILSWNALLLSARIHWAKAFPENEELIIECRHFLDLLLREFLHQDGTLRRVIMKGQVFHSGNLDDYAYLIRAIMDLYMLTQDDDLLNLAGELIGKVQKEFGGIEGSYYYYSSESNKEVFIRKVDLYDNTIPSGNAVMSSILLDYGLIRADMKSMEAAMKMVVSTRKDMVRYPTAYGEWLTQSVRLAAGPFLVFPINEQDEQQFFELKSLFLPNCIVSSIAQKQTLNEIDFKTEDQNKRGMEGFYICRGDSCEMPARNLNELLDRIIPAR